MSKRPADDAYTGQPFQKALAGSSKHENVVMDEMGEFEDAWEDDIESDEEVIAENDEGNEDGQDLYFLIPHKF